jgi:hypothetical protein
MTPSERLEKLLKAAERDPAERSVKSRANRERVDYVCRYLQNRACVRLLMSCLLAKLDRPEIDPRKPYTEIGTKDSFSGRTYDERYITSFIQGHGLPCNPTTAFLTPVLRNLDRPLTKDQALIGRPRELYTNTLILLDEVARGREKAENVLLDTIRILVQIRNEQRNQLETLQAGLRGASSTELPLSSEAIVTLLAQHLKCKNSSRLPVLIVAAAYEAVGGQLGEQHKPLHAHTAADEQTGAAGDVEITLINEDQVRTIYEMKRKTVTADDANRALQKVATVSQRVDNYIFITTDHIDSSVHEYAASLYQSTGGTEFAVLDCIGFLRHFLHLFHRKRAEYLNAYQALVLAEPESAVGFELKQVFLTLRRSAEVNSEIGPISGQ